VQCFAESSYDQVQTFELAEDASLVLVDWCSSGRAARGERWAFRRYRSTNRIRRGGELILHDSVLLDQESGSLSNQFRTGRFNCIGTLVLIGPAVSAPATEILTRIQQEPVARSADLVMSASALKEGVIVRFAGVELERVGFALHEHLRFVTTLLEGDPWSRKW
jgi:urease accessory protein